MKNLIFTLLGAGALLASSAAYADEKMPGNLAGYEYTGKTANCVVSRSIDRTTPLDDSTILFEMRGGKTYLNSLYGKCPRLAFSGSFAYKTSGSQLCAGEIITVLYSDGGPGASCALGRFDEIREIKD